MESIKENTVKAENQVKKDENVFYLGNENAPFRVAVLGNSITRHGPCAEIGWSGLYGMAASCEEKDYVHLLAARLKRDGVDCRLMVNQISEWERTFARFDLSKLDAIREFSADAILFRCGENVAAAEDKNVFRECLQEMIAYIDPNRSPVVFTTCFWKYPALDECIRSGAAAYGAEAVELGDLGDDPAMKAVGLFEHSGVAAHPGDAGMQAIADRIYPVLRSCLRAK